MNSTPQPAGINQTQLTLYNEGTPFRAVCFVDSTTWERAAPEERAGLRHLLGITLIRRGGDPETAEFSAEPVGPQIRLVAVDGNLI